MRHLTIIMAALVAAGCAPTAEGEGTRPGDVPSGYEVTGDLDVDVHAEFGEDLPLTGFGIVADLASGETAVVQPTRAWRGAPAPVVSNQFQVVSATTCPDCGSGCVGGDTRQLDIGLVFTGTAPTAYPWVDIQTVSSSNYAAPTAVADDLVGYGTTPPWSALHLVYGGSGGSGGSTSTFSSPLTVHTTGTIGTCSGTFSYWFDLVDVYNP